MPLRRKFCQRRLCPRILCPLSRCLVRANTLGQRFILCQNMWSYLPRVQSRIARKTESYITRLPWEALLLSLCP